MCTSPKPPMEEIIAAFNAMNNQPKEGEDNAKERIG